MLVDLIRGVDSLIILRSSFPKTYRFPVSTLHRALVARAGRVIWDVDDDIIVSNEISASEYATLRDSSDVTFATHPELLTTLGIASPPGVVLNTTDGDFERHDVEAATLKKSKTLLRSLKLVWAGSASGLEDLRAFSEELDQAAGELRKHAVRDIEFVVVCNRPLDTTFDHLRLRNVKWTRVAAVEEILQAHVGLMPLKDSAFARGKGGFKLVQYMAAGLPVAATAVGFNEYVVQDGRNGYLVGGSTGRTWSEALLALTVDVDTWRSASEHSRARWLEFFSFDAASKIWAVEARGERE